MAKKYAPITEVIYWIKGGCKNKIPDSIDSVSKQQLFNIIESDARTLLKYNHLLNTSKIEMYNISSRQIAKSLQEYNGIKNITYVKSNYEKKPPVYKELHNRFPHLKSEELKLLLNKNPDFENQIYKMEYVEKIKFEKKEEKKEKSSKINNGNLMLINGFTNYQDKTVTMIYRNGSDKILEIYNDDIVYYESNSYDRIIEDIDNLKKKHGSFSKIRYNSTAYNNDIRPHIQLAYDFRKNNEEANYKYRIVYIDIEIFSNGYEMDLQDLKSAGKKYTTTLITLYDNYTEEYQVLVFDMDKTGVIESDVIKHIDESKNVIINNSDDSKKEYIKNIYNGLVNDKIKINVFKTEKDLLIKCSELISEYDPDIITGWHTGGSIKMKGGSSEGFDIPFLYYRYKYLGIPFENKYGELVRENVFNSDDVIYKFPNMIILDYLELYKSMQTKTRESYSLKYISKLELGVSKLDVDNMDSAFFKNRSQFIAYNIMDVHLVRMIDEKLKYFNLKATILKMSNIGWEDSVYPKRIVEGIFYTMCMDEGKVMRSEKYDENKQVETVEGGYVRVPIKGIYNWGADLDLSSLYPYIISRYNISPDTLVGHIDPDEMMQYLYFKEKFFANENDVKFVSKFGKIRMVNRKDFDNVIQNKKYISTLSGGIYKSHSEEVSIVYVIIKKLLKLRKVYKNKMYEALTSQNMEEYDRYNQYQLTVKICMNSIYGGMTNQHFRMYNSYVANSITSTGREVVKFGALQINNFLEEVVKNKSINNIKDLKLNPNFYADAEKELKYIIYGDSVSGNSILKTNYGRLTFDEIFDRHKNEIIIDEDKEYIINRYRYKVSTLDRETKKECMMEPKVFIRHKVENKKIYNISTKYFKKHLTISEDHGIIVNTEKGVDCKKVSELTSEDELILQQTI